MNRLIALAALALALAAPCVAFQWDTEEIYQSGLSAGDCTLLYTGASAPMAAYAAGGTVRLATRDGSIPWPYTSNANCGAFGGFSSAASDGSGHIAIPFIDDSGASDVVKCAINASGSWAVETVADIGMFVDHTAAAFDSSGAAWAAFCDGQFSPSIAAAKRLGANSWQTTAVSPIGSVTAPSIAIAPDNTPYISFVDSATKAVKVAHPSSTGVWIVDAVEGSAASPADGYTSVTIDSAGRPAVGYFGESDESLVWLKYAVRNGASWQSERVLQIPWSGEMHCSVAVAPDGTVWIAYLDTNGSNLACAWKTGSVWSHETVDPSNLTGFRPSLRLDRGGNPSIAYADRLNGNVMFTTTVVPRTVAAIKSLPDGVPVRCQGLISSTKAGDGGTDFADRHYLQSSDRSMGIAAYYGSQPDTLARGVYVTVTGITGRVNGERAILVPAISAGQLVGAPAPLGMTNSAAGGGPLNYSPGPPSTGQKGIAGASGLNNLGLLVRTWGWVVETDAALPPSWVKIDDGSGVKLKCLLPAGVIAPTGFVCLTGISSCEEDGSGNLSRLLRIRDAADVGP